MLIRISLIVAILAGLGVAGIAFFPLQTQIKQTITDRDKFDTDLKSEKVAHNKTKGELAKSQADLTKTKTDLASAQQERDSAKATADEATKRADELASNLKKTQQDLASTSDKLAAWDSLGMPITKARDTLNSLKRVTEEEQVLEVEKQLLFTQSQKYKSELERLKGGATVVQEPEGLSGKVLAVDPKFDFVVLDVGQKQGVLPRGELLVSRAGKLVAKLVITDNIQQNQCIADVMPGPWKQSDVMEGDLVFNSDQ